ncbi:HK97 gp10 family phage protein [Massilia sp. YIM B02443]|uniref:HK97 gp10 family phage protein n=1 Tax=Massilia sp. YIM B02443 TaxID=3050127 RepID=UPI0025B660A1|nr:HK97 gp10 family phage protein [Massilia sp. YIM B02443]
MIEFDSSAFEEAMTAARQTITEAVGESTLRTVGFAGAEILCDQAKQNSLKYFKTGILYANIIVKRLEEESDGGRRQTYLVTVRNGRAGDWAAYYWKFVEFGHKFVPRNTRVSKKTGRTVGWKAHRKAAELEYGTASAPAYPFMRPAFESKKQEAVDVMTRTLAEQIARNIK